LCLFITYWSVGPPSCGNWLTSSGHAPVFVRAPAIWILTSGYIQNWNALRMTRTSVFQTNRSQAVRLPKDVSFPAGVKEVTILRDGARRIIVPANSVWDDFFGSPGIDIDERNQLPVQQREAF
jgi:antitoxin VapB